MRSTLSPAFTGLKMRQMFDFVVAVSRQTADTLKNQRLSEVEFKDLAMKFTGKTLKTDWKEMKDLREYIFP